MNSNIIYFTIKVLSFMRQISLHVINKQILSKILRKNGMFTFLLIIFNFAILAQTPLHVDFKYAPDWYATSICLPDDTFKTLVAPQGQLLYDYGGKAFFPYAGGRGFKTVVHILPDEQIKFTGQKLYSPGVPIVETDGEIYGLSVKQEVFSYSSEGLADFGKKDNWAHIKDCAREDIVITTIINKTNDTRTINPVVIVNSVFEVGANGNIIKIDNKKLFLSLPVVHVRQNLGEHKTIVELTPINLGANETKNIAAIYNNGKPSGIVQNLYNNPKNFFNELQEIRRNTINYWEKGTPVPYKSISIPDTGIQDLIDASLRNIWQAREIINGKISFQVGPTCYRGLWIVDGAFLLEAATIVNKGEDAREGIEYMLSFQQPNGKFGKLAPDYWKENGIVLWACVRHAMLTQDKEWLQSVWPKLRKTVDFIKEMRAVTLENDIPLDDGLIPPGEIDGGISGAEDKAEYTNIYWNLLGLKAIIQAADWINKKEDAKVWQKEYDDFYAAFQKAAQRDMAVDSFGNKYLPIPMDPRYRSLPQRAQWAFCHGVYPGQLFSQDDPVARGTMDMLHTTLQEGMVMGTGWIIDGIWNYFASFYGHACLWMGEGERAAKALYAFANHASPLLAWREEHNPRDLERHFVGDMPHNWASAEFIRLAVHLLAIDRGDELHLFEGLPCEWVKPGMETALNNIATPFGQLTLSLKVDKKGKIAKLKISRLTDESCKKVIVHLGGWATSDKDAMIKLDPGSSHSIDINIQ